MPIVPGRVRTGVFVLLALSGAALAQSPPALEFEVASVKTSPPSDGPRKAMLRGGPGTSDPTQASWTGFSLRGLLTRAYNMWPYQIIGSPEVISQLNSNFYDIAVKVPPGATQDQFRVMLQNLLTERFRLVLHRDTKEFDAYELVVVKNGLKLKESSEADKAFDQKSPGQRLTKDANGVQHLEHPGTVTFMQPGANGRPMTILTLARAQSLDPLLVDLNMHLNRPYVDKTGLTGIYDYSLEFAPDDVILVTPDGAPIPPAPRPAGGQAGNVPDDPTPNLFSALQQQLGLRLEAKKIPFDVIVIDHADKVPTGN